ncbi:MAG TPA: MauE/DoxX family redox-associated membrane protein [Acidimicrobiales bacterium]|nr:MauE/DoxX family redox-associated membrane protein [Acidimicrobiales bacterium]
MELIGVYLAACLLLAVAGVAKARRPQDTARALAAVSSGAGGRGPSPGLARQLVRAGALAEALLGLTGLVLAGNRPAAGAVALSFGAFALYVAVIRRGGGALSTCGCFGTPDTPATRLHVVVDLGLAAAALAVAVTPRPAGSAVLVGAVLGHQPWHGLPLALSAVVCAWILFHVLSTLPRLQAARAGARGAA